MEENKELREEETQKINVKESAEAAEAEKEKEQKIPTWKKFFFIYPSISRSNYVLRALAGGYVMYLASINLTSLNNIESGNVIMIAALSAFLFFCGAHLTFSGAYALIKQEYR